MLLVSYACVLMCVITVAASLIDSYMSAYVHNHAFILILKALLKQLKFTCNNLKLCSHVLQD